jgi:uncharacterized protein YdhG (YjbR/CyaY superfamily)
MTAAFKNIDEYISTCPVYKTSKGAIQLPLDKPLPKKLIEEIVKYNVQCIVST